MHKKTVCVDKMLRPLIHNRKVVVWLLSAAFILMNTASGASWQCLDGHACPPGCTMQHIGTSSKGSTSIHACCLRQMNPNAVSLHCALCSSASPQHSRIKERCTSPVCVLHIQAKPDISTHSQFHFIDDAAVIPLQLQPQVDIPIETITLSYGSPRAPPDRLVLLPSSPRAPPVCL